MANQIAETILQQIGGGKFKIMTGAKNFLSHKEGALSFRIPSRFAKFGINYVKITLNASDTYDVEYGKVGAKCKYDVITVSVNIYADMLQRDFTTVTGLDTHL